MVLENKQEISIFVTLVLVDFQAMVPPIKKKIVNYFAVYDAVIYTRLLGGFGSMIF